MKTIFAIALCALALPVLAADDSAQQIDLLQAAVAVCQQQTNDANAQALQRQATMSVQIQALQKRVRELEEAAKAQKAKP